MASLAQRDSTALPVTLITHKVKAVWQKIFRASDHVKLWCFAQINPQKGKLFKWRCNLRRRKERLLAFDWVAVDFVTNMTEFCHRVPHKWAIYIHHFSLYANTVKKCGSPASHLRVSVKILEYHLQQKDTASRQPCWNSPRACVHACKSWGWRWS